MTRTKFTFKTGGLAGAGSILALGLGVSVVALAAEATVEPIVPADAKKRLDAIDERIGGMRKDLGQVASGYSVPLDEETHRLQRRLREAEVQSLLGDHYRAAIVLFDVVDRNELASDPQYPEAVFLLAESLRRAGLPRAAQGYYLALARTTSGERLAQVVLGLLDVSSRTGEFEQVESLVRRVKAQGPGQRAPQLDFAYGKALFRGADDDLERLGRALKAFRSVPAGHSVSAPAAYYAGVTLVRLGYLDQALPEFEKAARLSSTHPDAERVRELAMLSVGRIQQELGHTTEALDAYQAVSKDSVYFADMLYEVAWVHVKSAETAPDAESQRTAYERALDATELLVAAAPLSPVYPRAKVLQGNLQIRLGAPETAYDTFQAIVDRYGGTREDLTQLLESRGDARAFFDELVAVDAENIGSTTLIPPLVASFALGDPGIERAVGVRRELQRVDRDLEEMREMVRTLEVALRSEQRFGMFPGLRSARDKALTVQNRLLAAETDLLDVERRLLYTNLSGEAAARLEAARARGQDVEAAIARLPTTNEAVQGDRQRLKAQYEQVASRAFGILSRVRTLRAQLQAARHWMKTNGVELSASDKALTEERMERAAAEIGALESALDEIRVEVDRASLLSRGDGGWARAERLRQSLYALIDEQAALLRPARSRASSEAQGITARIDQQRQALRGLERELVSLQGRLEQAVQAKVDAVRARVLDELRALEAAQREHIQLSSQSEQMLGPVAERAVSSVGQELDALVVAADVGILDVAWARKRERTDEVTELVRELRRRSNELQKEFGEVLQDDEE